MQSGLFIHIVEVVLELSGMFDARKETNQTGSEKNRVKESQ